MKPVMQKEPSIELPKLRKSARDAPHCFSCLVPNHDGRVVLCHPNWQEMNKGVGLKGHDVLGCLMCQTCHDQMDSREGQMSIDERFGIYNVAHRRTLVWWVQNGYLRA